MKTIYTLLVSSVLLFACGNSDASDGQQQKRINDIEVEEMKKLMADQPGVILDVRTPSEVAEGYIEGAENIDITQGNFIEKTAKLDKDAPVYVYCKMGGRSANASEQLAKAGYTKIYNLMGGFEAWKSAGYPTVK